MDSNFKAGQDIVLGAISSSSPSPSAGHGSSSSPSPSAGPSASPNAGHGASPSSNADSGSQLAPASDLALDLARIKSQVGQAVHELLEVANLKPGQILVLGCSTSEIAGKRIGSSGNVDIAEAVLSEIMPVCSEQGLYLAVQACEHLNRALVVEQEAADKYHLEQVSVYPVPKAGGSSASTAMRLFHRPVVVEEIVAHAGIDIGDTLIGMHLKRVAVPVRLSVKRVGDANLVAARTRPKLIGGARAVYTPEPAHVHSTTPKC